MKPIVLPSNQCTHASSCSCASTRVVPFVGSSASSQRSLLSAARTGKTARVPSSEKNTGSMSTSRSGCSFVSVFASVFSFVSFAFSGALRPVFSHCTFPVVTSIEATRVAPRLSPTFVRDGMSVV